LLASAATSRKKTKGRRKDARKQVRKEVMNKEGKKGKYVFDGAIPGEFWARFISLFLL
jgi:hypothetical protein